eukprot:scaffold12927_cov19-Tisochrysis_lutea.AAC.1
MTSLRISSACFCTRCWTFCNAKAPTPAAPEQHILSDSRGSSINDSGCSSAYEHEPVQKKQAPVPVIVGSRAAELWALLESKGGC